MARWLLASACLGSRLEVREAGVVNAIIEVFAPKRKSTAAAITSKMASSMVCSDVSPPNGAVVADHALPRFSSLKYWKQESSTRSSKSSLPNRRSTAVAMTIKLPSSIISHALSS